MKIDLSTKARALCPKMNAQTHEAQMPEKHPQTVICYPS
jgi:hypothetical protein